jgi:phospholipase A1/A2
MNAENCIPCFLTGLCLSIFLSVPTFAGNHSETSQTTADCSSIEDNTERLQCYDRIAGKESAGIEPDTKPSYFSRIWELDEKTRQKKYSFRLHRSTYVLPFTYNTSPNVDAIREADPNKDLKKPEVVFQMSFKIKLLQNIFGRDIDLWFGYTQRSFWQLYNFEDSSPFRETNYEPEFLLNFKTNYNIFGLKWRFVNFGFNHQSNGQSEPLSRSWNRIVANFGFEKEPFSFLLKTWYRIPESAEVDDNPEIRKYLGHGELWTYYFYKKHRFGLMLRDNFSFDANRGAVQAEWSFPTFFENLAGYVQYFHGYGENLLDYNHRINRIGIGFMVVDWN